MTQKKIAQDENPRSDQQSDAIRAVMMSDQEVIEFIRECAVMAAVSNARDRINMMMALIALLATLIGGGVVFLANSWIGREISASSTENLKILRQDLSDAEKRLNDRADIQFSAAEKGLEAVLDANLETLRGSFRDEVKGTITFTLLLSEADSLANGYSIENANRLIDILTTLKPEIEALEGQISELAYRRVEDILDIFNATGDYPRTYKVYEIFKNNLPLDGGIYHSLAIATTSSILIDPQNAEGLSEMTNELHAVQFTPESDEIEFKRAIALFVAATENGWTLDDLTERIAKEGQREPFFLTLLDKWLSNLENEIQPGNINHTPEAIERHATAVEALAVARGFLQSDN